MVLGLHQEKVTQTGLVTLGLLTILGRCMIRSDRTAVGFEPTFASLQEDNRGVFGPAPSLGVRQVGGVWMTRPKYERAVWWFSTRMGKYTLATGNQTPWA